MLVIREHAEQFAKEGAGSDGFQPALNYRKVAGNVTVAIVIVVVIAFFTEWFDRRIRRRSSNKAV